MLDPIHIQGITLCLQAFITFHVESLYVDAHEPCLCARRAKLYLQYASKIKSLPEHPTHDVVFDDKYIKLFDARPKIVLDLVHLKKDRIYASIYQQLFMEIRDMYRDHIPVYTDGSRDGEYVACAIVFPSDTVISMRIPDSASIFMAEVWAIVKALEEIKDSVASKYIIFTDSLSCLQVLQYMKLEHALFEMVCLFKFCK